MNINNRIRELRKSLGKTQEEFSACIGVKRSTEAMMEKEGTSVTEQSRKIICDKFNVSRTWLETGEGDMFLPDQEEKSILDQLCEREHLSPTIASILRIYLRLDARGRAEVSHFIEKTVAEIADQQTEPHDILDDILTPEAKSRLSAQMQDSLRRDYQARLDEGKGPSVSGSGSNEGNKRA